MFVNMIHPRILENNIDYWINRESPLFFHSDANPILSHALVYFVDKTHVVIVTMDLIWLLFLNIVFFNFSNTEHIS